jgi:hypothetical protein
MDRKGRCALNRTRLAQRKTELSQSLRKMVAACWCIEFAHGVTAPIDHFEILLTLKDMKADVVFGNSAAQGGSRINFSM